jgi:hypothetical protein
VEGRVGVRLKEAKPRATLLSAILALISINPNSLFSIYITLNTCFATALAICNCLDLFLKRTGSMAPPTVNE